MKKIISILLIITTILSLCACTNAGSNTKITIGVMESVSTLDPVKASNLSEKIVADNCFEGLLRLNAEGNVILGGAVRYSVSGDDLTYTFKLNDAAKWYVPSEAKKVLKKVDYNDSVTATDYAFGIERYKNSGKSDFDSISAVEAPDEFTLVIKLSKPDIDILYKLATLPVYPCNEDIYNGLKGKIFSSPEYTPCNGAYFIKESSKPETVLERNNKYSGNLQIFNRFITLYTTGSTESLKSRLTDKTYDLFIAPSTESIDGLTPTATTVSTVWGFSFNMKTEIGANGSIRAILLSSIFPEHVTTPSFASSVARGIIPKSFLVRETAYLNFNPEEITYPYDTEKATKLLIDLDESTIYTVNFAVPAEMKESADILVQAWGNLFGDLFKFNVITFELNEVKSFAEAGNYDLAILPLFPERNTASSILEGICHAPCYATKEDFLKSYDSLPEDDEIAEDLKTAEKYIVENGIFVPLFTESNDIYSVPELSGIYSANGGRTIYLNEGTKTENDKK